VLSYCWGGGVGFKTTTCTLAYAETGLGLSEVPQTIQDAVFVALELRLRYIWIDRLRIVQDDYEEFSKEIQKNARHLRWCTSKHNSWKCSI